MVPRGLQYSFILVRWIIYSSSWEKLDIPYVKMLTIKSHSLCSLYHVYIKIYFLFPNESQRSPHNTIQSRSNTIISELLRQSFGRNGVKWITLQGLPFPHCLHGAVSTRSHCLHCACTAACSWFKSYPQSVWFRADSAACRADRGHPGTEALTGALDWNNYPRKVQQCWEENGDGWVVDAGDLIVADFQENREGGRKDLGQEL